MSYKAGSCRCRPTVMYKYLVVDLDLVTLLTSYPGTTANWVFYRLIRIPLSTPIFLENPKHSVLSTRLSLHSSMYANIIYPGESFHTFTFNTSINIRNNNRPKTIPLVQHNFRFYKGSVFTSHIYIYIYVCRLH